MYPSIQPVQLRRGERRGDANPYKKAPEMPESCARATHSRKVSCSRYVKQSVPCYSVQHRPCSQNPNPTITTTHAVKPTDANHNNKIIKTTQMPTWKQEPTGPPLPKTSTSLSAASSSSQPPTYVGITMPFAPRIRTWYFPISFPLVHALALALPLFFFLNSFFPLARYGA